MKQFSFWVLKKGKSVTEGEESTLTSFRNLSYNILA